MKLDEKIIPQYKRDVATKALIAASRQNEESAFFDHPVLWSIVKQTAPKLSDKQINQIVCGFLSVCRECHQEIPPCYCESDD